MPQLRLAQRREIDAILRESHDLWGSGLTYSGYRSMWLDLMATSWGRKHLRYLVWVDAHGTLLSSAKLYNPLVRMHGRTSRAAGIGAVFTPKAKRRQGHARDMLRALLDRTRADGQEPAMLFTDIGTAFYSALGFRALPAEEARGWLGREGPRPPAAWELRTLRDDDLPNVRRAHEDGCEGRPFAVLRDREQWEFLIARATFFFARLDRSDLGHRYCVALYRGRFAGYLIAVAAGDVWTVREVGAPGADPEALTAILRLGACEARAARLRQVHGWFPRAFAGMLPEWKIRYEKRARAVPMLLSLRGREADLEDLDSIETGFIPYLDQF